MTEKLKFLSEKFMRRAVAEGRKNLRHPQGGPFGACIVRRGKIVAATPNSVLTNDATGHAEINAIREACRKLKTYSLNDCEIYSTTEPCPMCFSAIHWAAIPVIVYGTGIRDVQKRGFNELPISNRVMKALGKSSVRVVESYLRGECLRLLTDWDNLPQKKLY